MKLTGCRSYIFNEMVSISLLYEHFIGVKQMQVVFVCVDVEGVFDVGKRTNMW